MSQDITTTGRLAYSISEICALTGLGRDAVYTAIRDGCLAARKVGKRTLVLDSDLHEFLAGLPRAGGREQVMSEVATIKPPAPVPAKPKHCTP